MGALWQGEESELALAACDALIQQRDARIDP